MSGGAVTTASPRSCIPPLVLNWGRCSSKLTDAEYTTEALPSPLMYSTAVTFRPCVLQSSPRYTAGFVPAYFVVDMVRTPPRSSLNDPRAAIQATVPQRIPCIAWLCCVRLSRHLSSFRFLGNHTAQHSRELCFCWHFRHRTSTTAVDYGWYAV